MAARYRDAVTRCERRSAEEHDLARHASLSEQLVRAACLRERQPLRDERLDRATPEQLEQCPQILVEPFRLHPLEPLDAVEGHAPPSRQQPATGDAQEEGWHAVQPAAAP